MIALQAAEYSSGQQLVNIIQILIIMAAIIALTIIAVSIHTSTRTFESPRVASEGREEGEEPIERPTTRLVRKYEVEVLQHLGRAEAVDVQELLSHIEEGGNREHLSEAIANLRESGLVEFSGGFIVLTEKGKRTLDMLREKQWIRETKRSED